MSTSRLLNTTLSTSAHKQSSKWLYFYYERIFKRRIQYLFSIHRKNTFKSQTMQKFSKMQFRCNYCHKKLQLFKEDTASVRRSILTSCFHVFCGQCRNQSAQSCLICKKPCRIMGISREMPSKWRVLFEPVENLLKQWHKFKAFQFNQANDVRKRQRYHINKNRQDISNGNKSVHLMRQRVQNERVKRHRQNRLMEKINSR